MKTKRFRSALSGFLLGALWGGIIGAILFGLRTYFSDSSSTLGGADRNWTWLFMIFGLVCGLVIGAILGTILGVIRTDRTMGVIMGLVIGVFIAAMVSSGDIGLGSGITVSCSILGWLISNSIQAREQPG
jgi:hypothetical protein